MQKQPMQRITVEGEFTIFAAAAIRERLLAAFDSSPEIEVDLTQVTEIDSAGIQLMVSAKKDAAARAIVLRFAGHSPAVVDVVDLCELSAYFGDPVLIQSRAQEGKKP